MSLDELDRFTVKGLPRALRVSGILWSEEPSAALSEPLEQRKKLVSSNRAGSTG